jgi:hypothetical protein
LPYLLQEPARNGLTARGQRQGTGFLVELAEALLQAPAARTAAQVAA